MSVFEGLFVILVMVFVICILKNVEDNYFVAKQSFYNCYHKRLQTKLLPMYRYEYNNLPEDILHEMVCEEAKYTKHYVKTLRKTK